MKEVLFIWYFWFFRFYSFVYLLSTLPKVMPLDSEAGEERKGMYQHPIIQKAVNVMWFQNKQDEGIRYTDTFKPIPVPAIALVLTAVSY